MPEILPVTNKYSIPLLVTVVVAGLIGNYFKFPLFLNIDFLFGSIFAMLALQFFGLGRGILAGAIIAGYTYFLWNHPYAIIIMTAEVAIVGWLMNRRKIGMVLADTLYWLIIGMPLVFLFYHLVMHVSINNTTITMTKQAVNGIANALIARLIFTGFALRSHSIQTSLKDIVYNLLAFFVLCPALIMMAAESRSDFNTTDHNIRTALKQNCERISQYLESWLSNRKLAVVILAKLAATKSLKEMQSSLEQTKESDNNFLRIGLLNKDATIIAYHPLLDELGKENIGKNFADRPFIPLLKQALKPLLSEVVMGRVGDPKPMVTMLAPVIIHEEYGGYVSGILSLDRVRSILDNDFKNATLYTLLDKNSNVIMSNRTDQTVMKPFVRDQGTIHRLDAATYQWIPPVPSNISIMERWKKSFYVAEITLGDWAEWKLILEQPIAPYQEMLFKQYSKKLMQLFLILLGALALAEFLSRRTIATIEQLRLITNDLPIQLATNEGEIIWPRSAVKETSHLVNNFRKMARWLTSQFNENRQINESLEHRVAERTAELKESEERYRSILNASPVPMGLNDEQQHITFLNPAFIHTFGYTLDDIPTLSHWWPQAYPDLDYRQEVAKAWQDNFEAAKRTGTAFSPLEVTVRCKDLTNKVVLVTAASLTNTSDGVHLVVFHDITERKHMEQVLQQSEVRLSLALMANQNAVWDWDLLANELYYSPYWWKMIGYEENELVSDPDLWRRLMHPDDLERANQVVSEALASGENSFQIETRLLHKNGHYVPVLTRGFILRNNNSNPVRVSGTNTDLTERKIVEEANRQLTLQFQQLAKTESLHRMAGAIAHTFNNLLGATMGYLDLAIADLPPKGSSSKFLASAFQATERAAEVSSMMLTYLGISFVENINLDLSEVCRRSLTTLKGLIKKNIIIASDFPSSGPVIIADANQLQRLLRNLVINASEAIQDEQGTITLAIRTVSSADIPIAHRFPVDWQPQGDHFACLMVKDTGEGIAAKDIDKLFDPFFTSKFAGRGLGLAMVLGILRMHKGLITVESEPDRGSVFQVFLPLPMDTVV